MKVLKISKVMTAIAALSAVFFLFQNCSKVGFNKEASTSRVEEQSFPIGEASDTTGVNIVNPTPVDPSVISASCVSGTIQEKVVQIGFQNPGVVCEWGQKGNLSILDSYFRARRRQSVKIPLPRTATICAAEFDFGAQEFWYDDVFILTLDDNVLVSSYNWVGLFDEKNDFYQYDWDKMVGEFWDADNKSEDYCAGNDSGLSSCSFPSQHDTAPITLDIQPELLRKAMANSGYVTHTFNFITTGDNDSTDCQHFNMTFDVKIKYVD